MSLSIAASEKLIATIPKSVTMPNGDVITPIQVLSALTAEDGTQESWYPFISINDVSDQPTDGTPMNRRYGRNLNATSPATEILTYSPTEYVLNGSFTTYPATPGDPTNWVSVTFGGATMTANREATDYVDSPYAVKLIATNTASNSGIRLTQALPTLAAGTYIVTVRAKRGTGSSPVRIDAFNITDNVVANSATTTSATYVQVRFTFTAITGKSYQLRLSLGGELGDAIINGDNALFDKASIVPGTHDILLTDRDALTTNTALTGTVLGSAYTFAYTTDYTLVDSLKRGDLNTIRFGSNGTRPDPGTTLTFTYTTITPSEKKGENVESVVQIHVHTKTLPAGQKGATIEQNREDINKQLLNTLYAWYNSTLPDAMVGLAVVKERTTTGDYSFVEGRGIIRKGFDIRFEQTIIDEIKSKTIRGVEGTVKMNSGTEEPFKSP